MKFKVTGEAKYEYEVEAEDEELAVEVALDKFHQQTFQTYDDILEWKAEKIK